MPSKPGLMVGTAIETLLGRPLSKDESLRCEELVINAFPMPLVNYIKRLSPEKVKFRFDYIYNPLFCGVVRGAVRRVDKFKFTTPNQEAVYDMMHGYLGDGFTANELDVIVWLAQNTTTKEVIYAIEAAKRSSVFHAGYVKAIIEGNRRKAGLVLKNRSEQFKKVSSGDLQIRTGVPDVKQLQDGWSRKLKRAIENDEANDVEQHAKHKTQI